MNNIKPGSIWKAVRAAKNMNPDTIPVNLTLGGYPLQHMTLLMLSQDSFPIRSHHMPPQPELTVAFIMAKTRLWSKIGILCAVLMSKNVC